MAKRGGFPGGMPGNMNNLMKQAQRMQRQMEETTKELEEKEYTAAAGGGAVTVTVSGKKEVVSIKLSEEVVDPDDIEMLQDLIVAATNEAFRQMEAANLSQAGADGIQLVSQCDKERTPGGSAAFSKLFLQALDKFLLFFIIDCGIMATAFQIQDQILVGAAADQGLHHGIGIAQLLVLLPGANSIFNGLFYTFCTGSKKDRCKSDHFCMVRLQFYSPVPSYGPEDRRSLSSYLRRRRKYLHGSGEDRRGFLR